MGPTLYQAREGLHFVGPYAASLWWQPLQLVDQGRNLPVIEHRIAIGIDGAEKRKRSVIQIADGGCPQKNAGCPGYDLTAQFTAYLNVDHPGHVRAQLNR